MGSSANEQNEAWYMPDELTMPEKVIILRAESMEKVHIQRRITQFATRSITVPGRELFSTEREARIRLERRARASLVSASAILCGLGFSVTVKISQRVK